jgi:hypothetical protein
MILSIFKSLYRFFKSNNDHVLEKIPQKEKSVYFITMHKCASTLFSNFVLPRAKNLQHVDYLHQIEVKKFNGIDFQEFGFLYGPCRVSVNRRDPLFRDVIRHIIEPGFLKDKRAVFFVRDPRDILISSYYSFGFSHAFSENPELREMQEQFRNEIRKQTLDEYCVANAASWNEYFALIQRMIRECKDGILLRYEELIHDFDAMAGKMSQFISLSEADFKEMKIRSRPQKKENIYAHQRSGLTEDYARKLKPETIYQLNSILADTLKQFGYSVHPGSSCL